MKPPIEFYFDFSSPYGYIASNLIEAFAAKHGRAVTWNPILLGVTFKLTGNKPLTEQPLKGEYSKRDFARSARFHGLPYRYPSVFPIGSVAAARAVYWAKAQDEKRAVALVKALYRAYFVDDVNINEPENVVKVAAGAGFDGGALAAALGDQALKDRTRVEVEKAIAKGVFGSPFFIVDGEPFWGVDRMEQMDRWLATGGW